VSSLRSVLVVVTIVATSAANLPVAAQVAHGACAKKHHACGDAATIAPCCCGDRSDSPNPGGPIEARVQLTADPSPIPVAFAAARVTDTSHAGVPAHISPPRFCPVDLQTLYARLLI
jgi:hypothetical protein